VSVSSLIRRFLPRGNVISVYIFFYLSYASLVSGTATIISSRLLDNPELSLIINLSWNFLLILGCSICLYAQYKRDDRASSLLERAGLIAIGPATFAYAVILVFTPGQRLSSIAFFVFALFVIIRYVQLVEVAKQPTLSYIIEDKKMFDRIYNNFYSRIMRDPELVKLYEGLNKEEIKVRTKVVLEAIEEYDRTGKFSRKNIPPILGLNSTLLVRLTNNFATAAIYEGVPMSLIEFYILSALAVNRQLISGNI
jgi:hypothetical protein